MLKRLVAPAALTLLAAVALGACANDGALNSTAALPEKPAGDPACATLAAKIDALRKDGVSERIAKASQGKGDSVTVKRASLAKASELDAANAEFQTKCSNYRQTASAPVPAAQPPASAAKTPAVATKTAAAASDAKKKAE